MSIKALITLSDDVIEAILPSGVAKYILMLRKKTNHLKSEIDNLKRSNDALESLRPHWAQGYSNDSIAAQASTSAKAQLWEMLNASSQTEAVSKLRTIIEKSNNQ